MIKALDLGLDGQGVLYEQLARALKRAILHGEFAPGSQLPPSRKLASMLGVGRNTVVGAYELLCAEQLAISRSGSGTHVIGTGDPCAQLNDTPFTDPSRYSYRARRLGPPKLAARGNRSRYNLQYGVPLLNPRLFNSWRMKLAAASLRAYPGYPPPEGHSGLRSAICEYLARRRGFVCSPEHLIIVSGTQQALTLVARVVLDEGSTTVLEDPHYEYVMRALLVHGAHLQHVPVDAEGMIVSQLSTRPAPRLVYVSPSHQFPSGVVMSLARRIELLRATSRAKSWIFEDDYDAEFRYGTRPVPALRSLDGGQRVIYVGTFSKSIFPSLRLAYILAPPSMYADLVTAKHLDDCGCATIEQTALAAFIQGGQFEKHLQESSTELGRRRGTLLEGLKRWLGEHIELGGAEAGMHVVVWFPRWSCAQLERLIEIGSTRSLGLHSVHPYYHAAPRHPGLLIGFAGLSCNELATATKLLGESVQELLSNPPLAR